MLMTETIIRPLTVEELPACEVFAREFHEEKQLGAFRLEVFVSNWTFFMAQANARIFSLWKDGQLIGGLGAMIVPDLSDGRRCATEMFWFVTKAHRNGRDAWKLIEAFEAWGAEEQVEEYRLSHLLMPNEDPASVRLAPLYRRKGYRALDVTYVKPRKG